MLDNGDSAGRQVWARIRLAIETLQSPTGRAALATDHRRTLRYTQDGTPHSPYSRNYLILWRPQGDSNPCYRRESGLGAADDALDADGERVLDYG